MRKKTSIIWTTSKQDLEKIARESHSISEILKAMGYKSITGTIFRVIKSRIAQDKIDISHISLGLDNNKGRIFGPRPQIPLSDILVEHSTYGSRQKIRRMLVDAGIVEDKCVICGIGPEWNGKPLTLQIDHKNGISDDNRIDNIRIVCPNCHTQTETFCGSNTRKKPEKHCANCGAVLCGRKESTGYCTRCRPKFISKTGFKQKSRLDSVDRLKKLVWEMPKREVAKVYSVSDSTISKWCKRNSIDTPPPGYWVTGDKFKGNRYIISNTEKARGEMAGSAKLTEEIVLDIRRELTNGATGSDLARKYSVDRNTISGIKLRKTWKHI